MLKKLKTFHIIIIKHTLIFVKKNIGLQFGQTNPNCIYFENLIHFNKFILKSFTIVMEIPQ